MNFIWKKFQCFVNASPEKNTRVSGADSGPKNDMKSNGPSNGNRPESKKLNERSEGKFASRPKKGPKEQSVGMENQDSKPHGAPYSGPNRDTSNGKGEKSYGKPNVGPNGDVSDGGNGKPHGKPSSGGSH